LSSVELDKKEWEGFLEKLSELEEKYMSVLRELDEARSQLHTLEKAPTPEKQETMKQAKVEQVKAPDQVPKTTQFSFLQRLSTKLRSLQAPPTPPGGQGRPTPYRSQNASCSRCGYRINYSTRFCAHCGADFGTWICSCGRTMLGSHKFCDRCGRAVGIGV